MITLTETELEMAGRLPTILLSLAKWHEDCTRVMDASGRPREELEAEWQQHIDRAKELRQAAVQLLMEPVAIQ
jgi:hypothetical protein